MGHAVGAPAQQALLDDCHHLHRGALAVFLIGHVPNATSVLRRSSKVALLSFQVTIVIKYFFQFGFFPFNQNKIDKNKPYHPPNIIGVEKKDGYVHYDLVQLLALFFHRSILKVNPRTALWLLPLGGEKKLLRNRG